MKRLPIVLMLAAPLFAGKSDTTYLTYYNGKITVCRDSIVAVETWKVRTDTTRMEYREQQQEKGTLKIDTSLFKYRLENYLNLPGDIRLNK